MMTNSIAVVVISCDKYSDLWTPFFTLFEKFWPTCPFPVYLFANQKKFESQKYHTLLSGEDRDWSTSFKTSLKQVPEDYVIVLFDDVLLCESITDKSVQLLTNILQKYTPNYFRFRPYPQPKVWIDDHVGKFSIDEAYRTALFAVWKKDVLLKLLIEGESAWSFEMDSVPRSAPFDNFFGTDYDFIPFIHGVEKGLWMPKAVDFLKKNNIPIDLKYRREMTAAEALQSRSKWLRGRIYMAVPKTVQAKLFKASTLFRKYVWTKW